MCIEKIEKEGAICLKVTSKSLSGDAAVQLKAEASELMRAGIMNIELDLSIPEYIDSSGIGKILFMNKKMLKDGGEFSICRINPVLYEFLDSLAIPKVVKIKKP